MKVLLVTPDYPPDTYGGCGISAHLLASSLRAREVQVEVLAFTGKDLPDQRGVRHLPQPRTYALLNAETRRRIRELEDDFDLVHVYNTVQMPAAVSEADGIPVVATLNNIDLICPNPRFADPDQCRPYGAIKCLRCVLKNNKRPADKVDAIQKWLNIQLLQRRSKGVDRLLPLTDAVMEFYTMSGYSLERSCTIPNMVEDVGVEGHEFNGGRDILYVGRVEEDKGVHTLIEAFDLLDDENATLTIVGTGSALDGMRRLASGTRHADRISFEGKVDRAGVDEHYRKASVFVHPAIWPEPFGRTLLEAMRFSLPIVGSDAGALPEILDDDSLIFSKGDPQDLCSKLRSAIERIEDGERFDHSERLREFSPDMVANRMMSVYRECINDNFKLRSSKSDGAVLAHHKSRTPRLSTVLAQNSRIPPY